MTSTSRQKGTAVDDEQVDGEADSAAVQWARHGVLTGIIRSQTMHGPFTGPSFALGLTVDPLSLDEPLVRAYIASDAEHALDGLSLPERRAVLTRFVEDRSAAVLPLIVQTLREDAEPSALLRIETTMDALGLIEEGEVEDALGALRSLGDLLVPQGPSVAILSPHRNVPVHIHEARSLTARPSLVRMRHDARAHGYADLRVPLLPEHDDEATLGDALLAAAGAAVGASTARVVVVA